MVEKAAEPRVHPLRKKVLTLARSLTTPLPADDYLALLDPRWSARELTGTVVRKQPETADASTIVIRPRFDWDGHQPGQYLRLGVEVDGIRHWRAYTITADPGHPEGFLSVTVKRTEGGKLSPFFVDEMPVGGTVFLGEVEGQFTLPDPLPDKLLMISAGSGITPIWSHLRELERRDYDGDVFHIHGARTPEDMIFGEHLRGMHERRGGYTLHEHHSKEKGRVKTAHLDELVPDWREREAFLSGPRDMIDAMEEHWEAEAEAERLHTERFQPVIGEGTENVGGGTVRFRVTDCDAECEPGVSILVGGERAGAVLPFGCRMGICHTCVGRLRVGRVRDLRTGEIEGEEGEMVRTCVTAPEGDVEIDL
ncbi:MAG: ferredoxin reductase [Solirubrobacterales bacterium]|nr:ferredoxin reductase [Solirubrobacterales bacterium]